MLKYEETERPSFVELAKLVLTSTENTLESPKGDGAKKVSKNKSVSKNFSNQSLANKDGINQADKTPDGKAIHQQINTAESKQRVQMINHRAESAKSNPYGNNVHMP